MEELSVIQLVYEIYKRILLLNVKLETKYRMSLGESALDTCTAILESLLAAKQAPRAVKKPYVDIACAKSEVLTLQLRAMLELKLTGETNILRTQAKLTEAKRQLGGWRKSL